MTQHKKLADEIESMKDAAAIFAAKQGLQRDTEKFKAGADFVFEMLEVFIKEKHASQFIKKDESKGMIQEIKDYFDKTPIEQIKKDWDETEEFAGVGPTVQEFIAHYKKEVVSSDVEQAAKDYASSMFKDALSKTQDEEEKIELLYEQEMTRRKFIAGAKWQSTQQPAIEWPSESELRQMFKNNSNCYADTREENHDTIPPTLIDGPVVQALDEDQFIYILSKLKERVNCVDPVEFAVFCSKYWKLIDENEPCWLNKNNHEVHKTEELMKAYQTSKINTNGKSK